MITASESNIIKNALKGIDYDRVILFGSRARGDNRRDSDFDIMVVFKNDLNREKKMRLSGLINKRLILDGLDCDILIRSENQINYLINKTGSITRDAINEGNTL
ncbi:MAG: nucleotidyltransferase domain-containing protein [Ignavibacteriae bacterium]|nr:nucleotidyltransferase domain-containing protein [Ignavibacteriota bacterium]